MTCVQLSTWPSLLSNQDYIKSRILIFFFDYDKIVHNILFDTIYDQRVSGFILCKDVPKINFLRPHAIELVFFFATTRNFQDKYILTYFGGSHLRARAAMPKWFKAPVLET